MLKWDQAQWRKKHHVSVNPKNFEHRKKVVEAFLKDFTILDDNLPKYVHKAFIMPFLDRFHIKYNTGEHKDTLWKKLMQHLSKETKESTPKKAAKPKKKVSFNLPTKDDNCQERMARLIAQYKAQTLSSLTKMEDVISSPSCTTRENEKEEEDEESDSTSSEDEDEEEEEEDGIEREEETKVDESEDVLSEDVLSFESVFAKMRKLKNMDAAQLTNLVAQSISRFPAHDGYEIYEVLSEHSDSLKHPAQYPSIRNICSIFVYNMLKEALEIEALPARQKYVIDNVNVMFETFQFTSEERLNFIQNELPVGFPSSLKKQFLKELSADKETTKQKKTPKTKDMEDVRKKLATMQKQLQEMEQMLH